MPTASSLLLALKDVIGALNMGVPMSHVHCWYNWYWTKVAIVQKSERELERGIF